MQAILLFTALITLTCLAAVQGQTNNYLLQALDAAMAMKSNFDSNAIYYRDYVTYERTALANNLNELIAEALEKATTAEEGTEIEFCAQTSSYFFTGVSGPVLQDLDILQNAALVYYRIILDELTKMNVFEEDFEIFYYQFNLRLNESYERLNDELLKNVVDNLFYLVDAAQVVVENLDACLKLSWGHGENRV